MLQDFVANQLRRSQANQPRSPIKRIGGKIEIANLKVTLVKSTIGAVPKHKKTVEALGLKKLNKTVVLPDNAATRGMVQQVRHLVKVEEEA